MSPTMLETRLGRFRSEPQCAAHTTVADNYKSIPYQTTVEDQPELLWLIPRRGFRRDFLEAKTVGFSFESQRLKPASSRDEVLLAESFIWIKNARRLRSALST